MTKTRLGRDPFKRAPAKKMKRSRHPKRGRRPTDPGLSGLWAELTSYWVPRIKACAYVRVVKLASRFA